MGSLGRNGRSRLRRTAALAASALVITAGAALAPAASADRSASTRIELRFEGVFEGELKSSADRCVGGRKVSLWKKKGGEFRKVAADRSSAEGFFGFPEYEARSGRYYAKVTRDRKGSLKCVGAKTGTVTLSVT